MARRDHQNRASRALRKHVPGPWKGSVYGESDVAAFAAADPGDPKTDAVDVRHFRGEGWKAQALGWNERRGMGDLVESAGPFNDLETAAKAAGDLVRKHFQGERGPADYMKERNYGRSHNFGNALDTGDFDFGGGF